MQITVFGATGGIGRHVVDQVLADGHDVVAYVRTPEKLDRHTPRLRVVVGELSDTAAIQPAVQGSQAVISALGPSLKRGATGTPVTDGTTNILKAMQATGVDRFIGLATPSVPDPHDQPATGTIRSGFLGRDKVGSAMTRAEIASFLISQLTDHTYHRAAPAISN